MVHKKIRIPKDSAVSVMEELGKMDDCIQFVDLNLHDYEERKNFGVLIERCDESIRRITNFENTLEKQNIPMIKYTSYQTFKIDLENDMESLDINAGTSYFDYVENELAENEKKLQQLLQSYSDVTEELDKLIEKKAVFDKSCRLLNAQIAEFRPEEPNLDNLNKKVNLEELLMGNKTKNGGLKNVDEIDSSVTELNYISGVIKAEDEMKMKRMIYRATRGRALPTFFDLTIKNKESNVIQNKKIFTIFLQGGEQEYVIQKILNICDLFGASRFNIPQKDKIPQAMTDIQQEIYEKSEFLKTVETSLKEFFKDKIGAEGVPARYNLYKLYFLQEKLLFSNLNKCKLRGNFIDGEVWIPEEKFNDVQSTMLKITQKDPSKLTAVFNDFTEEEEKLIEPRWPTYLKLNDFTATFQMIVSEYGVPRYREINPGIFTIITFPFMFGVMFGDIGHGLLLSIVGILLVLKNDEFMKTYPDLKALCKARYLFLFLGLCAFYNGWIYNDFFSIPLGIFGTCYDNVVQNDGTKIGQRRKDCVYPVGIDPKWYSAVNELGFLNSFKMKMSVIIGIIQMILGLILKGMNGVYFSDYIDFCFEFIPQFIFMVLLFGYLVAMIYIKWGTDWSQDTSKAPSLIAQLLNIFLNQGSVGLEGNKQPLFYRDDYKVQEKFQYACLIIGIICIPVMLLFKPIIEYCKLPSDEEEQGNINMANNLNNFRNMNINDKMNNNGNMNNGVKEIEMTEGKNENINDNNLDNNNQNINNDNLNRNGSIGDINTDNNINDGGFDSYNANIINEVNLYTNNIYTNVNKASKTKVTITDLAVNQIIETIEYVLGTVSHTASYLRLWALSLAHAQLSKVFFEITLKGSIQSGNIIGMFCGFFLLANITLGVLMGMDLLECSLHTLRLHWVEFQSKFYKADGIAFQPYSFKYIDNDFI